MSKLLLLALTVMFFSACRNVTVEDNESLATAVANDPTISAEPIPTATIQPIITPTPFPFPPTPVLQPAANFIEGVADDTPDGQYLFVESWLHVAVARTCEIHMTIDFPLYQYDCGGRFCHTQWSSVAPTSLVSRLYGSLSSRDSRAVDPALAIGFIGYGSSLSEGSGGAASGLEVIAQIPYHSDSDSFAIHALESNGAIIAEIEGDFIRIEPGQSWIHHEQVGEERYREFLNPGSETTTTGCSLRVSRRLTNFGLLDSTQIDLNVKLAPGLTPVPTPQPVLTGCAHHQPLGFLGWIWDIKVAADGSVWVGSNNGIAQFNPTRQTWTGYALADLPVTGSIRAIAIEENGSVWFTTWNGELAYFDGQTWTIPAARDSLLGDLQTVAIAPDNSIWFATAEGVFHWNRSADSWQHYTEDNGLYSHFVEEIHFTPDGAIWFTHYGAVSYLTFINGNERWRIHPQNAEDRLDHSNGYHTATTQHGAIVFGGQTFFDPDPMRQEWVELVYNDHAYAVLVDRNFGLWAARGDTVGLVYIPNLFVDISSKWHHYTTDHGLAGNDIRSMAFGADNSIWLGSENGMVSHCQLAVPTR